MDTFVIIIAIIGIISGFLLKGAFENQSTMILLQWGGTIVALILLLEGNFMKDIAYQKAYADAVNDINVRYSCFPKEQSLQFQQWFCRAVPQTLNFNETGYPLGVK